LLEEQEEGKEFTGEEGTAQAKIGEDRPLEGVKSDFVNINHDNLKPYIAKKPFQISTLPQQPFSSRLPPN
jgi:hypothetical protein